MMKLMHATTLDVSGGVIVVALGSFEQHGPHLPLSTDTLIAEEVSKRLARHRGADVGPTLSIGVSPEHMSFAGTISLSEDAFGQMVLDVISSLKSSGYEEVILVNGHGGNIKVLDSLELDAKLIHITKALKPYDHAGDIETSIMLFLRPHLVHPDRIRKHDFRWPGKGEWKDTKDYSESGVLGDPTEASAEKGREYIEKLVEYSKQI